MLNKHIIISIIKYVFHITSGPMHFEIKNLIGTQRIGFLYLIDKFIMASIEDFEIKSKCGVSPLITQPRAIKPSYFLIFFAITTGISKTPGTSINLCCILFLFNISRKLNRISWFFNVYKHKENYERYKEKRIGVEGLQPNTFLHDYSNLSN